MAKQKEPPKPMFPLKHDFYASLDNFIHQAGMLAEVVEQLHKMGKLDPAVDDIITERLKAFRQARFGDE